MSTEPIQLYHDGSDITDISVVGERSSGTNYCSFLVRKNFGFSGAGYTGWKHGFLHAPAIARGHLFIICCRNAFDWVTSVYAKPWHCPEQMYTSGFSDFIRSPWETVCDRPKAFSPLPTTKGLRGRPLQLDRNPLDGSAFENVIQLRNAKYRSFLGFRERQINSIFVQLEHLQKHPETFLSYLATTYGLSLGSALVTQSATQMGSKGPFGLVKERRDETKQMCEADRDFILDQLDHRIEAELGYHY